MTIPYTPDTLGFGRVRPRVTIALVVANVAMYALTSWGSGLLQISEGWLWWGAFIPAYLADPKHLYRLLTSMFLHANLLHIFFNMLFLYNFGRFVEQALGGKRFLALYLLSGLAAALFHAAFIPVEGPLTMVVPAIGASGAISGVLGAYLLLFPGSRLSMCFFYFFFPICFTASAAAYLIFWFAMQILEGYARASMGVAVFAHAGGFIAGMALLPAVLDRERHSLLRALTASQRVFRYLYLGATGLGSLSKLVLTALLLSLVAGGAYSIVAARELSVPVKAISFSVSFRVYCDPSGYLCDSGYEEETVLLRLNGRPRLASQIASSGVRVVYNRLEASSLIYDRALAGSGKSLRNLSGIVPVMGVPVEIRLSMEAAYDRGGVLDSARGQMRTTILTCTANVCTPSGEGDYDFEARALISAERVEPVANMVSVLSALSIVLCLAAIDVVLRKAQDLEVIA